MNLLFYRYGSICEPDIIDAIEELGHSTYQITEEIHNKSFSPHDAIKYVSNILMSQNFDCIFSINFFPFLSEICDIFKIRYICWIVDSPVMELYSISITKPFNRVFLFDMAQYEEIHPLNPDCVFYLPLAANVKSKDKLLASISQNVRTSFSGDVSFVGSLYTEKCYFNQLVNPSSYLSGYLNGIMQAQLKVYGYYFIEDILSDEIVTEFKKYLPDFYSFPAESFLTDKITMAQFYIGNKITALERLETLKLLSENFSTVIYTGSDTSGLPKLQNRGFAKTLTEMPIIFHESKINLNTTSKAIRSGLPLRLWDIMASGGFVLSNFQTELPEYFTPGNHLDTYGSMEELLEKCRYYLCHEKERQEIAHNGYEAVRTNHTFTIRFEQLLNLAFSR